VRLKADLTLFAVAVLWGSAFAAQRVAAQLGSVYIFNALRFLLAALILLPFRGRSRPEPGQWWWTTAAGGILFVASALQQAGLVTTAAGNAGFITAMYVVLVPFVVWVGWAERPTWLALFAVALAAGGAYLLSTAGKFAILPGDMLEAAAALFWALHVVVVGKYASRFHPISVSAGQLLIGGVLNLLASVVVERPGFPLPLSLVASIAYTAVFSLGLGYTLQLWGQRHTPPTDAAIILSLESVFAALAGWLVLHEGLVLIQAFGCLLILGATLISQMRRWGRIEKADGRPQEGS
jgi:drug/metabolite transporter (DMT)-like permease